MVELELAKALRERLLESTANLQLPTDSKGAEETVLKAPQIVNGYLAPKRSTEVPDFPYVIVRPHIGQTQSRDNTTCELKLLIGCFSEEYDGYEECLLVMSTIRTDLLERPLLANQFEFQFPLDWQNFDDQPWPEWAIEVTTRWNVYTPQRIPDEGVI